eukprot:scaffold378945_cov11-Prasinocladus_malaysianus.AAC.1
MGLFGTDAREMRLVRLSCPQCRHGRAHSLTSHKLTTIAICMFYNTSAESKSCQKNGITPSSTQW